MKKILFRNKINNSIWFEREIQELKKAVGELGFQSEQFEEIGVFDLEEVEDYSRFLELLPYYDDLIEEDQSDEEEGEDWG
jgi:hypothetical protein